jgi:hypothetical protein
MCDVFFSCAQASSLRSSDSRVSLHVVVDFDEGLKVKSCQSKAKRSGWPRWLSCANDYNEQKKKRRKKRMTMREGWYKHRWNVPIHSKQKEVVDPWLDLLRPTLSAARRDQGWRALRPFHRVLLAKPMVMARPPARGLLFWHKVKSGMRGN